MFFRVFRFPFSETRSGRRQDTNVATAASTAGILLDSVHLRIRHKRVRIGFLYCCRACDGLLLCFSRRRVPRLNCTVCHICTPSRHAHADSDIREYNTMSVVCVPADQKGCLVETNFPRRCKKTIAIQWVVQGGSLGLFRVCLEGTGSGAQVERRCKKYQCNYVADLV